MPALAVLLNEQGKGFLSRSPKRRFTNISVLIRILILKKIFWGTEIPVYL